MQLKKEYFDVLTCIEENDNISVQEISRILKLDLKLIEDIINYLKDNNYVDDTNKITSYGYEQLEPFRVKRAVLLAAGFGSRMLPITINTPKPLVLVNDKKIIETIIDALLAVDIKEIYIVVGYLKEQFELLLKKYPMITLIDNPYYNVTNNISSAYVARDKFCNSYIMEADLYINNPKVIKKYQYGSNYTGKYVEKTNDWCFEMNGNYISKLKIGGTNCYHTYCIAYFSYEDGKKMEQDIKKSYDNLDSRNKVWDYIMFDYFKDNYKMYIRNVNENDIFEIDTVDELKVIDKRYNY